MNVEKDLLPIGSIVILKEGEKKLMIIGVMVKNEKTNFDYVSCLYPEGYSVDEQYCFNQDDIDEVVFSGYSDEERIEFLEQLSSLYQKEQEKKERKEGKKKRGWFK